MTVTVRPATRADVERWHPGEGCSFRAWVAELDGEPAGIVGLSLTRPDATLFSAFDEALRPHLKCLSILRLIKLAQQACRETSLNVYALCSMDEPTAPGLLERLGFAPWGVVDGDDVWKLKDR